MGNCLGVDVQSGNEVGNLNRLDSIRKAEAEAQELISGTLSYCTWVELRLECRKLKDKDLLSKSDPMGVLYQMVNEQWVECGRTEMIANSLNPKFVQPFKLLYNFERIQKYKIHIADVEHGQNPATVDPAKCDFLGTCEFVLSEVVTAQGKKLVRPLTNKDGKPDTSIVVLVAEELSTSKETYRFKISATLRNVDGVGKPNPFLQINRLQEDGQWLPVYKSGVVKGTLSPSWHEISLRATQMNNGDLLRPLLLQVFDHRLNGDHRLLSTCELNTERMQQMAATSGAVIELQPAPGKPKRDCGFVQVVSLSSLSESSFLDYLAGGSEMGFVVAVDFTASNGDPNLPSSKHFIADGLTLYERAIYGIGGVLEYYDHDKVFPMYGFGGRYQSNPVNHCFPMGAPPDSSCFGINGLLQAYRQALAVWQLSGPTLFAPVIRAATAIARATVGSLPPKYTVLLILTDGAIMDMQDTVEAVIDASVLPMSILIVGIGREDFGKMQTLDGDAVRLSSGNRTAMRDIVQFVEFEKYAGDGAALARELLAELPGQFLEYMRLNNIKCPAPLAAQATMPAPSAPPSSGAPAMPAGVPYDSAPPPPPPVY